ncbi:unnamed protein product [Chrysoparadoxa australica]
MLYVRRSLRRPLSLSCICRHLSSSPELALAGQHYDLVVIGSGPAAQSCATRSARMGKKVAVIDKRDMVGGVCVHTGTIPSKTFREAVLHLTGFLHQARTTHFTAPMHSNMISIPDLLDRVKKVETAETDVVTDQLRREGVELLRGTARFVESGPDGRPRCAVLRTHQDSFDGDSIQTSVYRHKSASLPFMTVSSDQFLVACGTRPFRPDHIPFDGVNVFDSDQLLWGGVQDVPRDLIVAGAGVIGMEYASMINVIPGTTVTVIDPRPEVLSFADRDVTGSLKQNMRSHGARFLLEEVITNVDVEVCQVTQKKRVTAHLQSGKRVVGDALLYTMGRLGNTDTLGLEHVGVTADGRGLLEVNDHYQTSNPHIYACGDIIGYPALASTSVEQGRRAAAHMWSAQARLSDDRVATQSVAHDGFLGRESERLFPYGIYTIPEISMIGKTEAELTAEGVSYEIGQADYRELAKGQMLGGADGFLKLIFHAETLELLGVHVIGDGATEQVHIGQVVMSNGGSLEVFLTSVFNYPTLAEAYNVSEVPRPSTLSNCTAPL